MAALIVVTGSCAGSVTTPATQVADTTATVEGLVFDPVDATISYWFEYGRTTAYGSETPHRSLVISDRETHPVSEVLTDLLPGTTYHYQTCAQTHVKLCGGDRTLTTTGTPPLISTEPMLFPGFDPTVSDYVTRCGAVPLRVFVSAPGGTDVAVAGGPASTGEFTTDVPLTAGESFDFSTTTTAGTTTFHVRCLPADFPTWDYSRPGDPSANFYITTPQNVQAPGGGRAGRYVAIFDDHGVPVWWRQTTGGTDGKLLPDGTLAWGTTASGGTSTPGYESHQLDGSLVHTWRTVGSATDIHDFQILPNGNALIGSYPVRPGTTDLTAYGGPSTNGTLIDGEIQEVTAAGTKLWSWNTADHIDLSETPARWRSPFVYGLPRTQADGRLAFDWAHWNSIQQVGDTVVVSFRHLDAVYAINKLDGEILWKLGGTPTSKSLTVVGDPESNPLGGQHYARLLSDGTLTVYDNNTNESAPPRGVSYQIDIATQTATFVEAVNDPDVTASPCCGSAAELADGSWLMSWGGTPVIGELGPSGDRHFVLTFDSVAGSFGFSYRVHPIEGGSPTIGQLRAGMDAMP